MPLSFYSFFSAIDFSDYSFCFTKIGLGGASQLKNY